MFFLDLLRAIAIILITNSHLDDLYPNPVYATGGMFGNILFFFISGFGLSLSRTTGSLSFAPWMFRRAKRIAEPLLIAVLFMLAIGYFPLSALIDGTIIPRVFFSYWFLPTIIIFYVPIYFIIRSSEPFVACRLAVIVALAWYAIAYVQIVDYGHFDVESHVASKVPFYFIIMLSGVLVSRHWLNVHARFTDVFLLCGSLIAYLGLMILMGHEGNYRYQFLVHLLGLVWLVAVYRCSQSKKLDFLEKNYITSSVIKFLSRLSLWIYLLQEAFIQSDVLREMAFPKNIVVFWFLILIFAWAFSKISIPYTKFAMIFVSNRGAKGK